VSEFIETIIVGGGQAGASHQLLPQAGRARTPGPRASACHCQCLAQSALGFIHTGDSELPGADAGSRIRRKRSLRFMSFARGREILRRLCPTYRLPVRCGVEVQGVEKRESVFPSSNIPIAGLRSEECRNSDRAVSSLQRYRPLRAAIPADILQVAFHAIPQYLLFCPKARF